MTATSGAKPPTYAKVFELDRRIRDFAVPPVETSSHLLSMSPVLSPAAMTFRHEDRHIGEAERETSENKVLLAKANDRAFAAGAKATVYLDGWFNRTRPRRQSTNSSPVQRSFVQRRENTI